MQILFALSGIKATIIGEDGATLMVRQPTAIALDAYKTLAGVTHKSVFTGEVAYVQFVPLHVLNEEETEEVEMTFCAPSEEVRCEMNLYACRCD